MFLSMLFLCLFSGSLSTFPSLGHGIFVFIGKLILNAFKGDPGGTETCRRRSIYHSIFMVDA